MAPLAPGEAATFLKNRIIKKIFYDRHSRSNNTYYFSSHSGNTDMIKFCTCAQNIYMSSYKNFERIQRVLNVFDLRNDELERNSTIWFAKCSVICFLTIPIDKNYQHFAMLRRTVKKSCHPPSKKLVNAGKNSKQSLFLLKWGRTTLLFDVIRTPVQKFVQTQRKSFNNAVVSLGIFFKRTQTLIVQNYSADTSIFSKYSATQCLAIHECSAS